ncbi:MAG: PIG-L deacetylase family protein [Chthoniobacterales bacterium]
MNLPLLTSRSRVMLFAPHPDDESLATGVFLQRANAAGAEVRVVYATDGERNCWPQRLLERKVRIGDQDRRRWGQRRQGEALAALQTLGVDSSNIEFLSLPDQGITDLLVNGSSETMLLLAETIRRWRPSHLLMPSAADTHPDHSGLAVLLGIVLDDYLPKHLRITQLQYLVHGASSSFADAAQDLVCSQWEKRRKRRAIACHVTQVALSRRRFLAYANRPERFVIDDGRAARAVDGPIRSYLRDQDDLRLQLTFDLKPLRAEASLYLLGHDAFGGFRRLRTILPGRSSTIDLLDCATGRIASVGNYRGDAFNAELVIPVPGFDVSRAIFAKLDRRIWFFDEAGWIEIAPPLPQIAAPVRRELAVA